MSAAGSGTTVPPGGDQVRVSVAVAVPQDVAFEIFTNEIDRWWKRGPAFRGAGHRGGFIRMEPGVGGRLFESIESDDGERVFVVGFVRLWEPPSRVLFTWGNSRFQAGQETEVDVSFAPTSSGTMVTVVHRGWTSIPADHPVRHGMPVAAFIRSMGLWWGQLMTSLREACETHSARNPEPALKVRPASDSEPPGD
jgi:uncharacterized protein YndB with AHSA1/START domain